MAYKTPVIVCGILILALMLRLHNYAVYPQRGATSDEYAYAFLGTGLLTYHQPIGWSLIRNQPWTDIKLQGINFPVVQYFFDAPPLFGILVGVTSLLFGHWTFYDIDLSVIRLLPIGLSILAGLLLYRIADILYGKKTALWSLLIYSVSPIMVVNQRIVVTESLLTVFMLLVMLLTLQATRRVSHVLTLGIISALALFTKIPGVFIALFSFIFLLRKKISKNYIFLFLATAGLGALCFIAYGIYFNPELFWKTVIDQGANRELGPMTLWNMLASPMIVNKLYFDGWYLFGFISFVLLGVQGKKHIHILLPAGLYVLTLFLMVTQNDLHGWYALPLFPLMAIASAVVITQVIQNPQWVSLLFFLTVGLSLIKYGYEENFGLTATAFRILMGFMIVPVSVALILKKSKAYQFVMNVSFYLFIFFSAVLTWLYVHPG